MRISRNKILTALYVCVIFTGVAKSYYDENVAVSVMPVDSRCIVIDAGHGGFDPGKVASDGVTEKTINLAIASKLCGFLEQGGAVVRSTRIEDSSLSESKREDLRSRAEIANNSKADLFVSIHQNSFPKGSAKGAQVFYYKGSEEGKRLASLIQNRLKEVVDIDNDRVAKANDNYYVLKQIKIPSVIVECGFLSNSVEHDKLMSSEYQEKLAWAVYMGILDYFSEGVA
ncbi:MAG: N-acetylmuramoyl-L-alanine amidase [Clostridia bacterium]|nr:N-acetylmuramoyl-L-alanine amidase [Clostridia bacterium]